MKNKCNYCHGETPDDDRGNCGACGAPRESKKRIFQFPLFMSSSLTSNEIRELMELPPVLGKEEEIFAPDPNTFGRNIKVGSVRIWYI